MKQVNKKDNKVKQVKKKSKKKNIHHHKKYGTSKLETYFAENFLDKLGVKYIYQFEAKSIGRFYDFAIFTPNCNGDVNCMILIEIDGGYYHSDPRVVDEEKLNPMQKRNKRVDELKDKWALMNGIPIMRIWEKDIKENPKMVMETLKSRLYIENEKVIIKENKKKRHINKIK